MSQSQLDDLEKIYKAHHKWVFNLALNYVWNNQDAEEITQDVFIKVYERLDKFRGESHLKTWIYRITVNTALDLIKSQKRDKRGGGITFFQLDNLSPQRSFLHPGVLAEHHDEVAILMQLIDQLPKKQKEVLILCKIQGFSIQEASEMMQLAPKTVEGLVSSAKKNLFEKIQKEEEIDFNLSSKWISSNG
ncbi:MAG: polymerase sigma factor CnrH [Bacteroidota bacterium]|jgi:RNA polymerase sigma-70 factor (ECF subfamily)